MAKCCLGYSLISNNNLENIDIGLIDTGHSKIYWYQFICYQY